MATIAELLGLDVISTGSWILSPHAARQTHTKGFCEADVLRAAASPDHTSPNGRYPGQARHVRGSICAVVDPERHLVVTVYPHNVVTSLRPDQIAQGVQIAA